MKWLLLIGLLAFTACTTNNYYNEESPVATPCYDSMMGTQEESDFMLWVSETYPNGCSETGCIEVLCEEFKNK